MKGRSLFFALGAAAIVLAAVCFGALRTLQHVAADDALAAVQHDGATGTDFLLEGQPVRVHIEAQPTNLKVGDSLSFVMYLKALDGITSGERAMLGNLQAGALQPALVSPDGCQVSPSQATALPTTQGLPEFNWAWTVGCATAGQKAVQALLNFQPAAGSADSTPLAYHSLTNFSVTDPLPQTLLGGLSIVSALVGIAAGTKGLLTKKDERTATA